MCAYIYIYIYIYICVCVCVGVCVCVYRPLLGGRSPLSGLTPEQTGEVLHSHALFLSLSHTLSLYWLILHSPLSCRVAEV